jgi:hypothetical protein
MDPAGNSCPGDGVNDCTLGTIETSVQETAARETSCADAVDNDGDTRINDGCPAVGAPEAHPTPNQCAVAADDDADTVVNDGCPTAFLFDVVVQNLPTRGVGEGQGSLDFQIQWGAPFGQTEIIDFVARNAASGTIHYLAQASGSTANVQDPSVLPRLTSPYVGSVGDLGAEETNPPWSQGTGWRGTAIIQNGAAAGTYTFDFMPGTVNVGNVTPFDECNIDLGGVGCVTNGATIVVGAVVTEADVAITNQTVQAADCTSPAPTQINAGANTVLCLRKTIVNNGPTTPVDGSVTTGLTGPVDCTITPDGANPTTFTGLTNTPATVDERFTVNCSQPSAHGFTFNNAIAVTSAGVTDPTPGNNSMSTPFSTNVIAQADVAIAGQAVLPPGDIPVSTNQAVTLRKNLHNNGPFGPANVSITTNAQTPVGCTATPAPANPTSANLAVSVDVIVDEIWTVHCPDPSTHTFTFENSIATTDTHVTDPTLANNSQPSPASLAFTAEADVKIASQSFVTPPTQIDASANTDVTLRKTLHNNGPFGPVNVSITPSAVAPAGCTATPNPTNPTAASLAVSADVVVDEVWTLHCTAPSTHNFSFNNAIAVTDPHVTDPTPANNSASTPLSVDIIGSADVKISSQSLLSPPSTITQNVAVDVTLRKNLHNNGPFGPASVSIDPSAVAPTGCTATPSPTSASLPVSVTQTVDEVWTLNCTETGAKSFTFNNAIAVTTTHVFDPNGANNIASTQLDVTVVAPQVNADVKITGQSLVTPPTQMNASQDTNVTLNKTLHNNGPDGPVDVSITTSAVAPADCTATPAPTNPTSATLQVSVAQVVQEVWTLHCTQPSAHEFTFNNSISLSTPGATDPVPGNNSASTPLSVNVIASADAKINSQDLVAPPTEITQGQDTNVTLRKNLHNNGPFGPASVSIAPSAVAPTGCTATPSPTNPTSAGLATSVTQTVDEVWTLNCTQTGAKSFTFNNAIAVTTVHVNDPNGANNSASTQLDVTVVAPQVNADVKITGQSLVTPPTQMNASQDTNVTLSKTLHNNGPDGPVDVSITTSAVAPADCTATAAPTNPTSATLPVSVAQVVDEVWTLHCTDPSSHDFTFNNSIALTTPGATDPVPGNNSSSTPLSINVIASADAKINSQALVSPPTELTQGVDTQVTLRKNLHNNGPFGPANVAITPSAVAPTGCTATPSPTNPTSAGLPTSVTQTVDEVWTLNCTETGAKSFTFNDAIAVTDTHVVDPAPANNSASTQLDVTVVPAGVSADVKIVSQEILTPPTQMDVSANTDVTLRKTLHNNGPDGPVDVSISAFVTAPADCTVTPAGTNPTSATLPVSTTTLVDETWTLHCTNPSTHDFTFVNSISPTTPGATDPIPGNNSASTDLFINVIASADVKIVTQEIVSPPTEITQGVDTDITLSKTLHNNGPADPVDVGIGGATTSPAGCTATPAPGNPTAETLPVSVATVVDEVWTLNCTELGAKSFAFNNDIAITTVHVTDPNGANNSASTQLDVTVVAAGVSADVKIVGQIIVSPPAEMNASQDTDVTLRKTLHNNGPDGPVDVSITTSAVAPADCTATPDPTNPTSATLPVSSAVVVDEVWTLHCTDPSAHDFTFNNAIAITTPGATDPDPTNNSEPQGLSVNVIASADAKISDETLLNVPATMTQGQDVDVTLRKTLHNNGPFGPVDVDITPSVTPDTGCTATPAGGNPTSASLPVSTATVVDELWTVSCTETGVKSFTFDNAIAVSTPHVVDPDIANNSASRTMFVTVEPAEVVADVKIVSQEIVSPPASLNASENTNVTLRKTLHNNGPDGPVDVSITTDLVAPADCTSGVTIPGTTTLPVSTDVVVDEVWSIHCTQPSAHDFTFNNAIAVTTPGVTDPNTANNSASTPFSANVIANADVKITGQAFVAPPTQIAASQNTGSTDVTLRKTLHNNGGYGPVNVSVTASAVAPAGCTATTPPNGQLVVLPVSTDVVVDEVWTLHCTQPSTHVFTFNNSIAVTDPHVVDPAPANNSASTELSLEVIATADVKITGQALVSPPTELTQGQSVQVTLRKNLHNNGPFGPVNVGITANAVAPTGCTATPNAANPNATTLPQSTAITVDEVWTISCTETGAKLFVFENTVAVSTAHVNEPDTSNNRATTTLDVTVVPAESDVKISSQALLSPPSQLTQGQNTQVTLRKNLHNNGPFGPVNVGITATATAPTGCTATPNPANPDSTTLSVSTNVAVDEVWTLNCTETGAKLFVFENTVAVSTAGVNDPNTSNNRATTTLTVTVIPAVTPTPSPTPSPTPTVTPTPGVVDYGVTSLVPSQTSFRNPRFFELRLYTANVRNFGTVRNGPASLSLQFQRLNPTCPAPLAVPFFPYSLTLNPGAQTSRMWVVFFFHCGQASNGTTDFIATARVSAPGDSNPANNTKTGTVDVRR